MSPRTKPARGSFCFGVLILMLSVLSSGAFTNRLATAANSSSPSSTSRRMIGSILDLLAGGPSKGELIDPEKALPGRSTKMPNIDGLRHYVLGNKIEEVPEGYKEAVFANGVSLCCRDRNSCVGAFYVPLQQQLAFPAEKSMNEPFSCR